VDLLAQRGRLLAQREPVGLGHAERLLGVGELALGDLQRGVALLARARGLALRGAQRGLELLRLGVEDRRLLDGGRALLGQRTHVAGQRGGGGGGGGGGVLELLLQRGDMVLPQQNLVAEASHLLVLGRGDLARHRELLRLAAHVDGEGVLLVPLARHVLLEPRDVAQQEARVALRLDALAHLVRDLVLALGGDALELLQPAVLVLALLLALLALLLELRLLLLQVDLFLVDELLLLLQRRVQVPDGAVALVQLRLLRLELLRLDLDVGLHLDDGGAHLLRLVVDELRGHLLHRGHEDLEALLRGEGLGLRLGLLLPVLGAQLLEALLERGLVRRAQLLLGGGDGLLLRGLVHLEHLGLRLLEVLLGALQHLLLRLLVLGLLQVELRHVLVDGVLERLLGARERLVVSRVRRLEPCRLHHELHLQARPVGLALVVPQLDGVDVLVRHDAQVLGALLLLLVLREQRDVGLQLQLHLVEALVHLGERVVALAQLQVLLREHLVLGLDDHLHRVGALVEQPLRHGAHVLERVLARDHLVVRLLHLELGVVQRLVREHQLLVLLGELALARLEVGAQALLDEVELLRVLLVRLGELALVLGQVCLVALLRGLELVDGAGDLLGGGAAAGLELRLGGDEARAVLEQVLPELGLVRLALLLELHLELQLEQLGRRVGLGELGVARAPLAHEPRVRGAQLLLLLVAQLLQVERGAVALDGELARDLGLGHRLGRGEVLLEFVDARGRPDQLLVELALEVSELHAVRVLDLAQRLVGALALVVDLGAQRRDRDAPRLGQGLLLVGAQREALALELVLGEALALAQGLVHVDEARRHLGALLLALDGDGRHGGLEL